MEHHYQKPGGFSAPKEQVPTTPTGDEAAILRGLAEAAAAERDIDDGTARRIASQLHGGQASALYALASSGSLEDERLHQELTITATEVEAHVRPWINALAGYAARRANRGRVEDWADLTRDDATPPALGWLVTAAAVARSEQAVWNQPLEIWLASLTDYNNGKLHGVWVDATQEPEELEEAARFLLRNSYYPDAEEWAVFDYSGFPDGLTRQLGEYPSLALVSRVAQALERHGEPWGVWAEHVGLDNDEALERFEEHYRGTWDGMQAYAEHLLEELGAYRVVEEAPEWLRPYLRIDAELYGRDLEMEMVTGEAEGGVAVFDCQ